MRNSIAKYICISYFSVSVIQHHDQRLLCRKIYVGLTFQSEGQSWWGRQRSRSRKLAGHIFSCTQEVERELDVAQTLKAHTQSCTSSSRATYPQHSTTSPEKSIRRPGIQIHEPVGPPQYSSLADSCHSELEMHLSVQALLVFKVYLNNLLFF